jgi:integrase
MGALKRPGVRYFRLYDLRHTFATRHSTIVITLDTYSHVLPTMQQGATARLEKLLYGKGDAKTSTA